MGTCLRRTSLLKALGRKKESSEMLVPSIPGYDYGKVQRSPVSLDDFNRLQAVVGFTDDDRQALQEAGKLLADEAETLVEGVAQDYSVAGAFV